MTTTFPPFAPAAPEPGTDYSVPTPSAVLPATTGLVVAVDTETSGLFVDDLARVSIVSVAWLGEGGVLNAYAFPFDQGLLLDKAAPDPKDKTTVADVLSVKPGLAYDPEIDEAWWNLPSMEWLFLLDWLEQQHLVFHHAKFDLHMLRVGTRSYPGRELVHRAIVCTQIGQRELDPLSSTSLKPTSVRLIDLEADADQAHMKEALKHLNKRIKGAGVKTNPRMDLLHWNDIGPYATTDAELTLRLVNIEWDRLQEGEQFKQPFIEREFAFMKTLYAMEKRGLPFDADRCRRSAQRLALRKAELEGRLPFKPTIPAAKSYYFGAPEDNGLGYLPIKFVEKKNTATGRKESTDSICLDGEVVDKMVKMDWPFAAEYKQWNETKSALEKWYDNWPNLMGDDGRLRCSFRQTQVVTGRLSVERVQLQAIPHDYQLAKFFGDGVEGVRAFIKPEIGLALWEVDVSQAEVRIATCVAKCEPMRQRLLAGEDAHDATTRLVFGIDKDHEDWDMYRSIGKRLTFAMLYGAGVRTLMQQIEFHVGLVVSQRQANEWLTKYRTAFPEFVAVAKRAENVVYQRGYLRLVSGRQRHWGKDEYGHKAFNAVIQGDVAEVMRDVQIRVEREIPDSLLLQIHDSLVLEGPDNEIGAERAEQARLIVEDEFNKAFNHYVPFKADMKRWGKA